MLPATIVKRLTVCFLVLLLGPLSAWARPTTDAEAQRSVEGWLALDPRPLRARMGAKPIQVKAFKDSAGNIDYFVVSLDAGGFIIVAGDDLVEPIIAFAPQGTFDPIPQNPLYALVNGDLPGRLAEVREKEDQARAQKRQFTPRGLHRRAQSKWARLQAMDTAPSTSASSLVSFMDLRVEPLVLTRWDQGYVNGTPCYNLYNTFFTSNNYLSGCVATAMAQLMYHHTWPQGPVDSTQPFEIHVDGQQRNFFLLGGDGSGSPYAWGNMVLAPVTGITDIQRQAIGALTHDAGVAVHTFYALSASAANNIDVPAALTNSFGFSSARYAYNSRYSIPSANLNNMINPNLDARLPVLLGIIDPQAIGHEVVVDGYGYDNATLYHHLNLGWSGTWDAWYNLPTVNAGGYNFTAFQCIYNVFPEGSGEIISGRVLDDAGHPVDGAAITATTGSTSYNATSNSQGIYALAKIPAASTYTIEAAKAGFVFYPQTVSTGSSDNFGNTGVGNLWGIDFVQDLPAISLNQALDNDYLVFTTGGDRPLSAQTAVSFYGGSSAQSGTLGGNQSAWLKTMVVGPGTLSFSWKVSSEADYDFLEVFVDDVLQPGSISGEVDWQQKNISIPAGSHTIKWIYKKDVYTGIGSDCGWVDKVSFRKVSIIPALQLLLLDN